jgi:hypothetical protein
VVVCEIAHDLDQEVTIVTARGALTPPTKHMLRTAILKALAECPLAVMVDLDGLVDHTHTAPALFQSLHRRATDEYGVPLLWYAPEEGWLGDRLRSRHWRSTLHVHDTREQALAAAAATPLSTQSVRALLPPDPVSPSHARILVGEACVAWGAPELAPTARLIIFGLTLNAVTHARTDLLITAVRRRRYLQLSVRDGSQAPPRLLPWQPADPDAPLADRGTGLRVIDQWADAWGFIRDGTGKVVWATIRVTGSRADQPVHLPAGDGTG